MNVKEQTNNEQEPKDWITNKEMNIEMRINKWEWM